MCDVFAIKYQLRFRPIFVFVQATLDPVAGIKDVKKYARQEHGTKFSSREIGDYLFEMDANAEFIDIELNAVVIQTLFENQGAIQS